MFWSLPVGASAVFSPAVDLPGHKLKEDTVLVYVIVCTLVLFTVTNSDSILVTYIFRFHKGKIALLSVLSGLYVYTGKKVTAT